MLLNENCYATIKNMRNITKVIELDSLCFIKKRKPKKQPYNPERAKIYSDNRIRNKVRRGDLTLDSDCNIRNYIYAVRNGIIDRKMNILDEE